MPQSRIVDKVIGPSVKFRTFLLNIQWACLLFVIERETYAEGALLQESYVGCYKLSSLAPVANSSSTTIGSCVASCQRNNKTYAALQGGNACSCLDAVDTSFQSNDCSSTCNGNQSEFCGGQGRLYSIYTVCPIGLYGFDCNLACHCDQQIPCDRITGNCPNNKCYGNWTGTSCSNINASNNYLGCYTDDFYNRTLPQRTADGQFNCSLNCRISNYTYFGLEWYAECYCGNNPDSNRRTNENSCNTHCYDSPNMTCGGAYTISLYSVCPAGYYDDNCYARCNCINNARCSYANGVCPSGGCKPGWSGASCNARDCERNNGDCFANQTCLQLNLKYALVTRCMCPSGYHRDNLWDFCSGKDGCSNGESECDTISTNCIDTASGYNCICKPGFQSLNAYKCSDVDECLTGEDLCDNVTSACANTVGSYRCICNDGYARSTDITCSPRTSLSFSLGSIIGAVVGTAAGVAVLFLIIGIVVFMRRRRERESQQQKHSDVRPEDRNNTNQDYEMTPDKYEALRESRTEEVHYDSIQTDNRPSIIL